MIQLLSLILNRKVSAVDGKSGEIREMGNCTKAEGKRVDSLLLYVGNLERTSKITQTVFVKKVVIKSNCILFRLSNRTVQIHFFDDSLILFDINNGDKVVYVDYLRKSYFLNFHSLKNINDKGFKGVMGMEHGNAKPGKDGELALIKAYEESDNF